MFKLFSNNHLSKLKKEVVKVKNKDKGDKYLILNEIIKVIENHHQITLFDEQILAALALIDGYIIDMKTGEGKTFAGLLAACYLAKQNRKVNIISANDYLVVRDFKLNEAIFKELDITIGITIQGMHPGQKQQMYKASIVFSTAATLGFDNLSDLHALDNNSIMGVSKDICIIDEADSVLLDQGGSPLVNSSPISENLSMYAFFNDLVPNFIINEDFKLDGQSVQLTEVGFTKLEKLLIEKNVLSQSDSMYSSSNIKLISFLESAIVAHHSFVINVDYVVKDGAVLIVDPKTQRVSHEGRRWGNGLHQAIEAKESLEIRPEKGIASSISLQNYFLQYEQISAMSGTALIDQVEFKEVYNLDLIIIPRHNENIRKDHQDAFFTELQYKEDFLLSEIIRINKTGQPLWIATTTIEESFHVSKLLTEKNIDHNLINAIDPKKESEIISQAGKKFAITLATNMAGRGTDIVLGGEKDVESEDFDLYKWAILNKEVNDLGGLYILGYGRSNNKRVDEQLAGRAGRQGDNGEVKFLMSLDDPLASTLPKKQIKKLFGLLGIPEDEGVFHKTISSNFQNVQKRQEQAMFDQRKIMLAYDNIIQKQRTVFYDFRNKLLNHNDINVMINSLINKWANYQVSKFRELYPDMEESQQKNQIMMNVQRVFQFQMEGDYSKLTFEELEKHIIKALIGKFNWLKSLFPEPDKFLFYIKRNVLFNVDQIWAELMQGIEVLRRNVAVRTTGQKNPVEEFASESFILFDKFSDDLILQILLIALSNNHIPKKEEPKTEESTHEDTNDND